MIDRLKNFLLTTLIGGITVILPIVIFAWVIKIIVQLVGAVISPLSYLIRLDIPPFVIDVIAVVIIVLACFATGLFIRTQLETRYTATLKNTGSRGYPYIPQSGTLFNSLQARKEPHSSRLSYWRLTALLR